MAPQFPVPAYPPVPGPWSFGYVERWNNSAAFHKAAPWRLYPVSIKCYTLLFIPNCAGCLAFHRSINCLSWVCSTGVERLSPQRKATREWKLMSSSCENFHLPCAISGSKDIFFQKSTFKMRELLKCWTTRNGVSLILPLSSTGSTIILSKGKRDPLTGCSHRCSAGVHGLSFSQGHIFQALRAKEWSGSSQN